MKRRGSVSKDQSFVIIMRGRRADRYLFMFTSQGDAACHDPNTQHLPTQSLITFLFFTILSGIMYFRYQAFLSLSCAAGGNLAVAPNW